MSLYEASVPVFLRSLGALTSIADKAAAYAAARKIDPAVLLSARLYPDMLPCLRQFQIATDHAKGASARLAGVEIPRFDDNETTFDDLKARLAKTSEFVKGLPAAQIDGAANREVTLTIGGRSLSFKGQGYLFHFALPNFYFHMTTAYAILRHNGVELGKRDFMGAAPT